MGYVTDTSMTFPDPARIVLPVVAQVAARPIVRDIAAQVRSICDSDLVVRMEVSLPIHERLPELGKYYCG